MESMTFVHFLEFGLRARLHNIKFPETGEHFVKSDSFVSLSTHVTTRGGKSHKVELTVYYSGLGLGPEPPGKLITAINQHHVPF